MISRSHRPPPIAILSFDRPNYLEQVLTSLLGQQAGRLGDREIVLFQDGARNPFSGKQRAAEADIEASVQVFRSLLPGRHVERSAVNLGVALNFERAERSFFEDRGVEAAIFLEDDLVLSPLYLRALDRLIELAMHDERIGVVAAYGPFQSPRAEQMRNPAGYVEMAHNWAFAMTRRQWLRNQPRVEQYMDLIRYVDYRERPHPDIHRLYQSWGFRRPESSQDVTKGLACVASGVIRLNTRIVLGKYIGAHGLHMTPSIFEAHNFAATQMYCGALPDYRRPTAAEFDTILRKQTDWAYQR